jgi:hypothetical protein
MEGQYPIDLDALSKGQVLTVPELERLTGVEIKKDPERFRMRAVSIQSFIMTRSVFTAKFEGDELRILTDSEASVYNAKRADGHAQGIMMRNRKMLQVDPSGMDVDDAKAYERNLLRTSHLATMVSRPVRSVVVRPQTDDRVQRIIPKPELV